MAAIRCFINKQLDDWDLYVPMIAGALRSSVNKNTGFTANMLMLGREVASPIDISLPELQPEEEYVEAHLVKLQETLEKSQECAREVLKSKLKKMKQDYDATSFQQKYKAGDAVYVFMKANKKHKKLQKQWMGPAVIITIILEGMSNIIKKS